MESYVSSLATADVAIQCKTNATSRSIQQAKINAAIKGISEAIDTYEEDETKQNYGTIQYYGPIGGIDCSSVLANSKPKQSIEIWGTAGDSTKLWLGTMQPNGMYTKIPMEYTCCKKIEGYECHSSSKGKQCRCSAYSLDVGPPSPTWPATRWNCYCCIPVKTTINCEGAIFTNTGYCQCRDVAYPTDTKVDTSANCWYDSYGCIHWDYYTNWSWRCCYISYGYYDIDSCRDYSNACICIYQKYKI